MSRHDLDGIYAQVATLTVRSEAERLRLAAVMLAAEYQRLVDRGLDREVARLDRAAVVRAWRR